MDAIKEKLLFKTYHNFKHLCFFNLTIEDTTNYIDEYILGYNTHIVSIITKQKWGAILVYVEDNGGCIPDKILKKISQPFFTTKPTGQGTGLGLFISYDIVKAHVGKLNIESEEGKGTVFSISIPINNL